jgi:hypothetical protein
MCFIQSTIVICVCVKDKNSLNCTDVKDTVYYLVPECMFDINLYNGMHFVVPSCIVLTTLPLKTGANKLFSKKTKHNKFTKAA